MNIFTQNFLILGRWIASHETFSIKWQQVLQTCVNILKTSSKNVTKLKSGFKTWPKKFQYFLSILIFRILAKVHTKKQTDRKDV
jgi:hypothetical protein